jgi:hypothetical protein
MIESYLPYGILLLSNIIVFFKKGPLKNKILSLIVFIAAIFAILYAEGFYFRLLILVVILVILNTVPGGRYTDPYRGSPVHMIMIIAMGAMMLGEWVLGFVVGSQPTIILTIIAIIFAIMIIANSDSE